MRIISEKGEFDMPASFQIAVKRQNICLGDAVEKSFDIDLPATAHNLNLCGFSDRVDNYYKPVSTLPVIIDFSSSSENANLSIKSISEGLIDATVYLRTADFYSQIENKNLRSLNWKKIRHPNYYTNNLDTNVQYLIDIIKQNAKNVTVNFFDKHFQHEFINVPLITGVEFKSKFNINYPLVINQYGTSATGIGNNIYILDSFYGYKEQTLTDSDNNIITYTKGFGITPFLKLSYVLKFIFSEHGFILDDSAFLRLQERYADIYILNNTVDAIYGGSLDYSQLLPDVTVKEFLQAVCKRYAGRFVIDTITRTAQFVFFYTIFQDKFDADLSHLITSRPFITDVEFKRMVITSNMLNYINPDTSDADVIDINVITRDYFLLSLINYISVNIWSPKIEEINYMNNYLVVDGLVVEENKKSFSEILFFKKELLDEKNTTNNITVWFMRGNFDLIDMTETSQLYDEYFRFRQHSNIQVSTRMKLSFHEIEQLQMHRKKLIHGQEYLIEEIDYIVSGEKNTIEGDVEVKLRTVRNYIDR